MNTNTSNKIVLDDSNYDEEYGQYHSSILAIEVNQNPYNSCASIGMQTMFYDKDKYDEDIRSYSGYLYPRIDFIDDGSYNREIILDAETIKINGRIENDYLNEKITELENENENLRLRIEKLESLMEQFNKSIN